MNKKLGKIYLYLFIAFIIIIFSIVRIEAAARTKEEALESLKKTGEDVVTEIGKKAVEEVGNAIIEGVKSHNKEVQEYRIKPENCEENIIENTSLSCLINKQKETNQAYLEIYGKQSFLWSGWGKTAIPKNFELPDINIKVSFEIKNKIYSHDLLKRDLDNGSFHLFWDINYKDIDISKPLKVILRGTINTNKVRAEELEVTDYYNSDSWFAPSGREANVKAYGIIRDKKEVSETNIITNSNYSCSVNKQKGTNKAYLEITGQQAYWNYWGETSIPDKNNLPDVNIKVSFEKNNKVYSHDLMKRDWVKDSFHLYWDTDFKDIDLDKPIKVTFSGTYNPNTKRTEELKIMDYINYRDAPCGREANVKAFGTIRDKNPNRVLQTNSVSKKVVQANREADDENIILPAIIFFSLILFFIYVILWIIKFLWVKVFGTKTSNSSDNPNK